MKWTVVAEVTYIMEYSVEADDEVEAAELAEEGNYTSRDVIDVEYFDVISVAKDA